MSRSYAARVTKIEPFLAMEVMERAFAMEREGIRVLHFEIGEPDFPPPQVAVRACADALVRGETHYTDSRGLDALRDAIARDKSRRTGAPVDPGRVLVTNGTSSAMLLVFSLLVEAGDEVIVGTPHYPCYPNFIRYCGGEPVFVPTDPARGYALDVDAVKRARTPRTRAVLVCSPANPTGAVQEPEVLRGLAELDLPILSDEIYDGLVYDGARVTSALEVSDRAFVFDGFSKRYAMTGFRLGYAIVPEDAVRPLQVMQQNLFISANEFVQHAGVAALEHGDETVAALRAAFGERRLRLAEGLRSLGFRVPTLPRGAFYVFADARCAGGDSRAVARTLLERAQVAVTPGVDFGPAGEGWLRFSCTNDDAVIDEALSRIESVLPELS